MNEQTTKLIEQLAQKLGTTTEYLWSVLLKQAQIQSMVTLFQFLLIAILGYVLFKIHKSLSIVKDYDGHHETGYSHYEDSNTIMIIAGAIFAILVLLAFFCIGDVFNGFFNPEYWALSKVLSVIK